MMETVLGLACLLCVAVAGVAMVCRQRAFAERDEVRREAREWQAAALAGESMVIDQAAENAMAKKARDDYKRLWYASRQHAPETRDDDEPLSAFTRRMTIEAVGSREAIAHDDVPRVGSVSTMIVTSVSASKHEVRSGLYVVDVRYGLRPSAPLTDCDDDAPAVATGPRLFSDDRRGRPRCEHED